MRIRLLLTAVLALAGCQSIPDEGPSTGAVLANRSPGLANLPFVVIDLTAAVAGKLADEAPPSEVMQLPPARALGKVGVGDLLHVTLWQANPDGDSLLDHAALEMNARVDPDGTISVPFAGRLRVTGLPAAAAERALVNRLSGQTVAPQASVLVEEDQVDGVMVGGEIGRPGRVMLIEDERRLSDVIAMAGGPRMPAYATSVSVQRGSVIMHAGLEEIEADPGRDIELSPGDRVMLNPIDRHFYAFGAVNKPGDQIYPAASITLADALGRIAGLQDGRANPAGLFIFRRQPAELTRHLLARPAGPGCDLTQVVYRVNLRNAASFFIMEQMQILPRDIIYVSNSPLSELGKFASILAGVSSVAATPRNFGAY